MKVFLSGGVSVATSGRYSVRGGANKWKKSEIWLMFAPVVVLLVVSGATTARNKWLPPPIAIIHPKTPALSYSWSSDGHALAIGHSFSKPRKHAVALFDANTGMLRRTFIVPSVNSQDYVICIALSPDGQYIASAGIYDTISVWSIYSGKKLHSFTIRGGYDLLEFSPDSQLLAIGSDSGGITILNLNTGNIKQISKRRGSSVNSVAFSRDGKVIACARYFPPIEKPSYQIDLWTVADGKMIKSLNLEQNRSPLAFAPNGKELVLTGRTDAIAWNIQTGKERRVAPDNIRTLSSACTMGASSTLNSLRLWDMKTGGLIREWKHRLAKSKYAAQIRISPGGEKVACLDEHVLKIWDVKALTGK